MTWLTNSFDFFTGCSCYQYVTLLKFSRILVAIKVLKLCQENHDFRLNREKHIVALASAKTGTWLCSSSGPSGPRTRVFQPLSGPSGPRVTVSFVFWPSGNTAAGACQRPDVAISLTPLHQLWLAIDKIRFELSKFSKLESFQCGNCVLDGTKMKKIDRKMTILRPQKWVPKWFQKRKWISS